MVLYRTVCHILSLCAEPGTEPETYEAEYPPMEKVKNLPRMEIASEKLTFMKKIEGEELDADREDI